MHEDNDISIICILVRSIVIVYTVCSWIILSEARLYSGPIEIFRRRHRQPEVGLKTPISPQCSKGSLLDLQVWKLSLLLNNSVQTVWVAEGKQMLHGDIRKTRISPER